MTDADDDAVELANVILAGVGDGFCELPTGTSGAAWCRMFARGECSFLVEKAGITVLTPDDLGGQLEAEVRAGG